MEEGDANVLPQAVNADPVDDFEPVVSTVSRIYIAWKALVFVDRQLNSIEFSSLTGN